MNIHSGKREPSVSLLIVSQPACRTVYDNRMAANRMAKCVIGQCSLPAVPLRIATDVGTATLSGGNNEISIICVCAYADLAVGLHQQQQSESAGQDHRGGAAELAGEDHRGGAAELEHHRCLSGWIATALQLMGLRHEQGRS